MNNRLTLAVVCALFSGCALTPSQVATPRPVALKDSAGIIADPWVKELAKAQSERTGVTRIPLTTDSRNLQAQLELYAGFWRDTEGSYLLGRDLSARVRDVAVLTAAYYAIKSQLKEARYAGIFAALFGTASDTYAVETQARNYQIAAHAMICNLRSSR